jgi:hypothetical protein
MYVGKLGNPFSSRYLIGMRLFGVREQGASRITSNVKKLMRNRDFHKKQAIKHASSARWNMYKIE